MAENVLIRNKIIKKLVGGKIFNLRKYKKCDDMGRNF